MALVLFADRSVFVEMLGERLMSPTAVSNASTAYVALDKTPGRVVKSNTI